MSCYLHRLANEPSIGVYHVNTHIKKCVGRSVELWNRVEAINRKSESVLYDAGDASRAVVAMRELTSLQQIKSHLARSIQTLEALQKGTPYREVASSGSQPKEDAEIAFKSF